MSASMMNVLVGALLGCALSACGGDNPADVASAASMKPIERISDAALPALTPGNPPGFNFNLAPFTLQLPTGASGSVDTVDGDSLKAGYTNRDYFYTDQSDGAMVMMDPERGWTTSGSQHPRTELRENATWPTNGTNTLSATVSVVQVPDHTTIGQIFQGAGPSKPLCELQVTSGGIAQLLLEETNQGGKSKTYRLANVPPGKPFSYDLSLSGTTIGVKINGASRSFTMDPSFDGETFYFKAGNYDQTATSGPPLTVPGTVVKFYALALTHR